MLEFEHFRKHVGLLTFTPSVTEWCEKTNAIGMYSKLGKYGGTYAHKDIAFEFASAISPVFKLYLLNEFESKNDSLVKKQSAIKEEINKLFTKDEYMSDETAKKIKEVLKTINTLKLLKTGGREILPQGSCVSDFNTIEKYLIQNIL